MGCTTIDLTIDGALADPVIAAAMRADRVDPKRFETLLRATARDLGNARRLSPPPLALLAARVKGAIGGAKPLW